MDSRVAIVTGASSGMGESLTRTLVPQNWIVAMADIHHNLQLSSSLGSRVQFYHTDVSSYASQANTFSQVFSQYGRIDAVCLNAGILDRSSIYILSNRGSDEIPPEPDMSTTDVDWKGLVYRTQLAIHFLRKNTIPGGVVVATASIAAVHPHAAFPEYNGAKAAVLNFVRGSGEVLWRKEGVRINCVMPGIVATKIIPKEIVEAVSPECLTPVKTVTDAYVRLLNDETMYRQAIECSADKQLLHEPPPMLNGHVTKRAITVRKPIFKQYHSEISNLPDAIA